MMFGDGPDSKDPLVQVKEILEKNDEFYKEQNKLINELGLEAYRNGWRMKGRYPNEVKQEKQEYNLDVEDEIIPDDEPNI
ncbi:MAG TPA: hypothetical protein DEP72_07625 [Clostridiales bacterium]|nr:MAG: hypothetical protein A2Y18_07010 [Clostridiales bacterium GWD2_32_19]HCC08005.1 hypothetical protein [Clostridiales bacterium]